MTAEFGLMILMESGLSFLGLGIQPPSASWGSIMSVGRQYIERAPWIVAVPGVCLFLLVFSVNVVCAVARFHGLKGRAEGSLGAQGQATSDARSIDLAADGSRQREMLSGWDELQRTGRSRLSAPLSDWPINK